jgi:hypothetical protein
LAHLDGNGTDEAVSTMVSRVQELALGYPEGRIEVQLIGGFRDQQGYSEDLYSNIMRKFLNPISSLILIINFARRLHNIKLWKRVFYVVIKNEIFYECDAKGWSCTILMTSSILPYHFIILSSSTKPDYWLHYYILSSPSTFSLAQHILKLIILLCFSYYHFLFFSYSQMNSKSSIIFILHVHSPSLCNFVPAFLKIEEGKNYKFNQH